MKTSARIALAAAALLAGLRPAAGSGDAVVFAVSSEQKTTQLSSADLKQMYLGRITRWKGGRRVTLAIRPPGSGPGRAFFDHVLRMSDIDFSQHWLGVIFRGEVDASPRVLDTRQDIQKFLQRSPGGLAFLLASEIEADSSWKLLSLDGARPGDASYPYRIP